MTQPPASDALELNLTVFSNLSLRQVLSNSLYLYGRAIFEQQLGRALVVAGLSEDRERLTVQEIIQV